MKRQAGRLSVMRLRVLLLFVCILAVPRITYGDGIAPQYSSLTVRAGESGRIRVIVLQNRDREAAFTLAPAHCRIDRDGRLIFAESFPELGLKTDQKRYSAVPFIKSQKVKLRRDEWKEVLLDVSVPRSTLPGEYYAALVARPSNLVSVVIIVVEPASLRAEARITSLETVMINDQMVVRGEIENKGDTAIIPSAIAYIKKGDQTVDTVALEFAGNRYGFIMHDNTRQFSGTIQKALAVDDNYTAEVVVGYADSNRITSRGKFSVDRNAYLKLKGTATLEIAPSSVKLAVPQGGFYTYPVFVKNVDSSPVSFRIVSSEPWANPAVTEATLQPQETRAITMALFTPAAFDRLEAKVVFVPNRGRPYQATVTVYPKTRFD